MATNTTQGAMVRCSECVLGLHDSCAETVVQRLGMSSEPMIRKTACQCECRGAK